VPTPTPAPIRLQGVKLTPGDGSVDLSWAPPVVTTGGSAPPISDYRARCRPSSGTGDWIESTEGVSVDTRATIAGLANGTAYDCEIAAIGVDASAEPVWTAAGEITPLGRPAAPPKPAVAAADSSVVISVPPAADTSVARYRFECSSDGGNTWTEKAGVDADAATTTIGNLANGTNYICRAFAENPVGVSDASPLSDAFRPCGSLLECNPVYIPVLGGLFAILLAGIAVAMLMLLRGRTKGHVIAVVDVVHSANVGHGSRLGIGFMRQAGGRAITGIVADDGKEAEIRVRRLRNGKFVVRDRNGAHEAEDGAPVVVTDRTGVRHSLVLRAFDTDAASEVARRR
jgi:hypothetical protein